MKRLFCAVLSVALFVATTFSFCVNAFADSVPLGTRLGKSNTYYYYQDSTKTLYINGTGNMPNMTSSTADIPWIEWSDEKVKNIVVSEGVTSVGSYAFYDMKIESVTLPNTLTRIGGYSFGRTSKLKSITVPFGVTTLGENSFGGSGIEKISLPATLSSIGSKAFASCGSLQEITIPESVKTISSNAFLGCANLAKVSFASMTQNVTLGNYAFMNCPRLKSVTLPKGVTCGMMTFGYVDVTTKVDGFAMQVYNGSGAYNYAVGNGFDYTVIDGFYVNCGVENKNTFTASIINDVHHYLFTPNMSGEYIVYTSGDCDTKGEMYPNSSVISSNDDIDASHSGFYIKANFAAGKAYDIMVSPDKMTGDYSLFVYPVGVVGATVLKGSVTKNASQGEKNNKLGYVSFDLANSDLSAFTLELEFENGDAYQMQYRDYIAGEYLLSKDNRAYSCGENVGALSLGNNAANFSLIVEHSYKEAVVAPTEDEDGYTLHNCILCDDSYKDSYVETTSYIITGKVVLSENPYTDSHENNIPNPNATIKIDNRSYSVNSDGTFAVRTFEDCYAVFDNPYGRNKTVYLDVANGSYDYGIVVLEGYDFNGDSYVNAKDFAIFLREKRATLGDEYWQFANEFIIKYSLD